MSEGQDTAVRPGTNVNSPNKPAMVIEEKTVYENQGIQSDPIGELP